MDRLIIKSEGRLRLLCASEIDWVEAAANYVRVHLNGESYLVRRTMAAIEAELDPSRFVRIHRSLLVNAERVREVAPSSPGRYEAVLESGTRLKVSRSGRARLIALLTKQVARAAASRRADLSGA